MHHGENVLMVLDQDSKEVRYFSRNLMCPTSGISYQNPEPNLFSFNSPVIIAKDWDGKRNKYKKDYSKSKTVHKKSGFAPLGNTNLRYLNNWRS
jgi:excinuclease ABC subunit A